MRNHRSLVVTSLLHARNIPSGHFRPRPSSPFKEGLGMRLYLIFVLRCYYCSHNSCQISRCDSRVHTHVLRNAAICFDRKDFVADGYRHRRSVLSPTNTGQRKLLSLSGCCAWAMLTCNHAQIQLTCCLSIYPVKDSSL